MRPRANPARRLELFPVLDDTPHGVTRINTNLMSIRGLHGMAQATRQVHTSMERMATGQKINRASDDPAGMSAADNLKVQERTIQTRLDAIAEESHRLGAREGALGVLGDLLTGLDSLVLQAANRAALSDEELDALQIEADATLDAIAFITDTATFRGERVLAGHGLHQLGHASRSRFDENGEVETINYALGDLRAGGLLNLKSGNLQTLQEVASRALSGVRSTSAAIGSRMNSLESEQNQLLVELEGVTGARSLIVDTDYAKETAALVRARVLEQAGIHVVKIAQEHNAQVAAKLLEMVTP